MLAHKTVVKTKVKNKSHPPRPVKEAGGGMQYAALIIYSNVRICSGSASEVCQGARWMPWLTEAMKDAISCDKLRVGANDL